MSSKNQSAGPGRGYAFPRQFVALLMATLVFGGLLTPILACDLCAIASANSANGQTDRGWIVNYAQQYVPEFSPQFKGSAATSVYSDHVATYISHLVPGYNFSSHWGLSLNLPVIKREYLRNYYRINDKGVPSTIRDSGDLQGLGDLSLVARWTPVRIHRMKYAFTFGLLGGVKLPSGDSDFLGQEVLQARRYNALLGPGHPHDVIGQISSPVHSSDLTLGSGSVDGVFGLNWNARWRRFFFSNLLQYYWRQSGRDGYRVADEFMGSGGPGAYLFLRENWTLSVQTLAAYESRGSDQFLGQKSSHTGMTSWYLGPNLNLTLGEHCSIQGAIDVPLRIANRGYQITPDWRFHGGITWRF